MTPERRGGKRRLKRFAIILAAIVILCAGGFYLYTLDYYRADPDVEDLMLESKEQIETGEKLTLLKAVEPADEFADKQIGVIFYPGGKVEAIAYLPLLSQLADQGVSCVLVEMPFNLAVLNANAADSVISSYPEIDQWFLSGHSLGGAMASSYAKENHAKFQGLILMGAYPVNDADLPTLAIYGTEDIMLDLTKMRTAQQFVIEGGNHAYFGNYGEQEGDGIASLSRENQQEIAVEEIMAFIKDNMK